MTRLPQEIDTRREFRALFPIVTSRMHFALAQMLTVFSHKSNFNLVESRTVAHYEKVFSGRKFYFSRFEAF